ncbi:(2Fe-2S) ferredoxin domain-containing protein [Burkholderia multivorans]|uniref:(2Fe-2S) ferredoxin domain-containing protein n=1 Tax=Burkholderia multivorans TaxID=87883 RepID=UPI00075CAF7D|nr:NAD(P)H-dependent oxidoreductase subunit E [Burkholderia multivorans]KVR40769.1 hypothetical protein WK17_21455 [Burkholderia multivorans]
MSHYQYHVFFCTNAREKADACNNNSHSEALCSYAKKRVSEACSTSNGRIRINRAGCLDRCANGPVVVIYPEGTWYTYLDTTDIDDIVDQHLVHGRVVERLLIDRDGTP